MPYSTVIYEKTEHVASLILNKPLSDNRLNLEMANELLDVCQAINRDDEIRVVILSGAGNTFCSGSALDELPASNAEQLNMISAAGVASRAVASINCPVIAAITGDALGSGLELALACDIRLAAEHARFGFPETSYGLIPGGGGTQRLPRIVGKGKATEIILSAEPIDADEAYRIGLVARVIAADRLLEEAHKTAQKLVSRAPIAVRYAKEAVYKGMDMTLEQGLRLEADLSFLLQTTEDRAEGISAFLEKRKTQFKGK